MLGEIAMSEVRAAAFATHAARNTDRAAARSAALAAGHAAATAHVASHSAYSANYAVTAANDSATAEERDWQYRRLPKHLRPVAFPARGEDSALTLRRCTTSCVSTTATPSLSA